MRKKSNHAIVTKRRSSTTAKGNIAVHKVSVLLECIANPIVVPTQNDYGLDLLCEYLYGDDSRPDDLYNSIPSGISFGVQVKACKDEPKLKRKDISYLEVLEMPTFFFWVRDSGEVLYKRVTPEIYKREAQLFVPFEKYQFLTDFAHDYIRVCSRRGSFPVLKRSDGKEAIVLNVIEESEKFHLKMAWIHLLVFGREFQRQGKTEIATKFKELSSLVAPSESDKQFVRKHLRV